MCLSKFVGMLSTTAINTECLVLSGPVGLPQEKCMARQAGTLKCLHPGTVRPARTDAPSLPLGMCVLQPVFQ